MTIPHLIRGLSSGLNIGADFTTLIGSLALLAAPNPLAGSFALSDLSRHNFPIEHDASISRRDVDLSLAVGETTLQQQQLFHGPSFTQYISFFAGKRVTDVQTVAAAKYARFNDSRARNPQFVYGPREAVLSYGENALFLQALSDPVSGAAQLGYVRMFFEEERLPWGLGWRPSVAPITLASLGAMVVRLSGESPGPGVEGLRVLG